MLALASSRPATNQGTATTSSTWRIPRTRMATARTTVPAWAARSVSSAPNA